MLIFIFINFRYAHVKYVPFHLMDILEPELIWINKRCYRFYESSIWKSIDTSKPYMEDEQSICSEEESEIDIKIIPHNTGFKHAFYVPK